MEDKLFIGFGVVALICGIVFIIQQQYLLGIAGSIVGIGLVLQNLKKIQAKKQE